MRMNSAVDWTAKEWQRVAHAALVIAAVSFTSLVFLLFQSIRSADERLVGTWQSDADRTVAGILESRRQPSAICSAKCGSRTLQTH